MARFDFVVASARNDGTTAIFYDGGASGFVTEGEVSTDTGFGLQLKTGIQWVPIPEVRLGLSVASPTFAFVVIERFANTFSQSPQRSGGSEFREAKGGWWGVEPGNLRFGIAYVGNWGWVEADLVVDWRLRTPDLEINQRATVNGRIGSAFRLVRFTHLGLGLFTDRSPVDQLGATPPRDDRCQLLRRPPGPSICEPRHASRSARCRERSKRPGRLRDRDRPALLTRTRAGPGRALSRPV